MKIEKSFKNAKITRGISFDSEKFLVALACGGICGCWSLFIINWVPFNWLEFAFTTLSQCMRFGCWYSRNICFKQQAMILLPLFGFVSVLPTSELFGITWMIKHSLGVYAQMIYQSFPNGCSVQRLPSKRPNLSHGHLLLMSALIQIQTKALQRAYHWFD